MTIEHTEENIDKARHLLAEYERDLERERIICEAFQEQVDHHDRMASRIEQSVNAYRKWLSEAEGSEKPTDA